MAGMAHPFGWRRLWLGSRGSGLTSHDEAPAQAQARQGLLRSEITSTPTGTRKRHAPGSSRFARRMAAVSRQPLLGRADGEPAGKLGGGVGAAGPQELPP